MPKDYRLEVTPPNQTRRTQNAQSDEWIAEFLARAQVGHVASRWDDQPFITPVNFWHDAERQAIYFHTNLTGRLRANVERHPKVCFEAFNAGRLLPSNAALEFGIQYESAVVFGEVRIVEDEAEMEHGLYGLLGKYFPELRAGVEYRPITPEELRRTAVFALQVQGWSGKRNWKEAAEQVEDWPPLAAI